MSWRSPTGHLGVFPPTARLSRSGCRGGLLPLRQRHLSFHLAAERQAGLRCGVRVRRVIPSRSSHRCSPRGPWIAYVQAHLRQPSRPQISRSAHDRPVPRPEQHLHSTSQSFQVSQKTKMMNSGAPSSGISLGDALRLPKRHPACRRREAQPGFRMERENLSSDAKGEITSG